MKNLLSLLFLLLSFLASAGSFAQGSAAAVVEGRYANVAYVSGGIGEDELDEIRARERSFNLKLLFAERSGAYLGDVNVVVTKAGGDAVFDVKSVGPFLLINLPAGSYEIRASIDGQVQQRRLSVSAKGRTDAVLRW